MPFQQVIVFSTNLEPRDLVDEAFLRRIPYKIPVADPTEAQFRQLFAMARRAGGPVEPGDRPPGGPALPGPASSGDAVLPPRDLLLHVLNEARYLGAAPVLSVETVDRAVDAYFSVI